ELCNKYKLKIKNESKKLVKKIVNNLVKKLFIIKSSISDLLKKNSNGDRYYLEDDPEIIPYPEEIESEIDALKDNNREDNRKDAIDLFFRKKNNKIANYLKDDKDDSYSYLDDNEYDGYYKEPFPTSPKNKIKNQYNQNGHKNVSYFEKMLKELCNKYKLKIKRKSKKLLNKLLNKLAKKLAKKLFIIKSAISDLLKKNSNGERYYLEDDPEVIPYSKELESEIDALKDNNRENNIDNQNDVIDLFFRKKNNQIANYLKDDKDDSYPYPYPYPYLYDDDKYVKGDGHEDDDKYVKGDGLEDSNKYPNRYDDEYDDEDDYEYLNEDEDDEYLNNYEYDDDEYINEDEDDDADEDDHKYDYKMINKNKGDSPVSFYVERDPIVEPPSKLPKIKDKPSYIKNEKIKKKTSVLVDKSKDVDSINHDYELDKSTKISNTNELDVELKDELDVKLKDEIDVELKDEIDVTLRDEVYDETERLLFERIINQESPTDKHNIVEKILNKIENIAYHIIGCHYILSVASILIILTLLGG
ncbi:ribosome releasing factor, partial [Plasmodium yoelii yoelii]